MVVPLAAAYVFLPLVQSFSRLVTIEPSSALGIVIDALPQTLLWEALAAVALLWLAWKAVRPSEGFIIMKPLEAVFALGTACLLLGALHVWASQHVLVLEVALRWLSELSPLIYLLFAGLWCWSFGLPGAAVFHRFGAVLAILVLADAAATGVIIGLRPPMGGLLLVMDREVLACLLGVALFSGMPGGASTKENAPFTLLDGLLVLGVAATFSRTVLFAAACAWLFLGRGSKVSRGLVAALFVGCIVLSLLWALPLTADAVRLEGHLQWMAGVEYYYHHPEALLTVQGLGPFSLSIPAPIAAGLGISAKPELFFPAQLDALWLRLAMVWGGWGVGVVLLATFVPAIVRPTRFSSGVLALVLAQGTVFPLFFHPVVGVVLWMALLAGVASWSSEEEGREQELEEENFEFE